MSIIKYPLLFTILFFANYVTSQERDIDFGKIEKPNLEMTIYSADSSASAVVLYSYGHSYFDFNSSSFELKMTFKKHIRIKILNKDGLSNGTFEIPLFHRDGGKEKIIHAKGYTFNLVNGKIERSKLKKANKFTQEMNEWNTKITYTFPNVKVGSIIDFEYTKTSDFNYDIESWYFQSDIPVVWSEYLVEIPEYYNYYKNNQGYISPYIYDEKIKKKTHTITNKSRTNGGMVRTSYENYDLEYNEKVYRFVYRNVPAFKDELYIGTSKDYISKVNFELNSVKFPNSQTQNYSTDYTSIGKKLLDHKNYGAQLDNHRFLKKEIKYIKEKYSDPEQRLQAAYNWVQENIKWDGYNSLYTQTSIKEVYKNKEGRAGGINLLLINFLKGLDLNTYPVALSTRKNGKLPITYPSVSSFNYTIAYVKIKNNEYLLDATSPNLPINQLPLRCLNGKGRIISENGGKWIELNRNTKYIRSEVIKGNINTEGEFSGSRIVISKNYAAYDKRKMINEGGGIEKYYAKYTEEDVDITLNNYQVEKLKEINSSLIEKMDISLQLPDNNGVIYFNPLLSFRVSDNPFVQEQRDYPIDFQYTSMRKYMLQMEIPEGYEITELPKKIYASLPDNAGKFTYQVIINGKNLMVISQINLSKQLFLPSEYTTLKQFYKMIVNKHSEVIVFKKIEV